MKTTKHTNLRPGFSASVTTKDTTTVHTVLGPVSQPSEVYVKPGGELPGNLADGEYDRLDKLGAFDPLPPTPVAAVDAQAALAALVGDEAKTSADVRFPSDEEVAARAALDKAQSDVRDAIEQSQAEAAAPDDAKPRRGQK